MVLHDELAGSYEVLRGIRDPRSSYRVCCKLAIVGPIGLDHLLHVPPSVGPDLAAFLELQTSSGEPHGLPVGTSPPTRAKHIETEDPEADDAPVEIPPQERLDSPIPEQVAGFKDRPGGGVDASVSRAGHERIIGHRRDEL